MPDIGCCSAFSSRHQVPHSGDCSGQLTHGIQAARQDGGHVRRKLLRLGVGHVFPPYSRQGTSSCFNLQSLSRRATVTVGQDQVPNFASPRRTKAAILCACTQEKWPPGPLLKLELAHELCQCPCLSHGAGEFGCSWPRLASEPDPWPGPA